MEEEKQIKWKQEIAGAPDPKISWSCVGERKLEHRKIAPALEQGLRAVELFAFSLRKREVCSRQQF